jgi:DNA-binding transcriptional LysR family regulator
VAELELRHLRAVRAVADGGSVSRAATVLGVSQPALTAQLKRIERILGGDLFVRGPSGVRTTELGRFVLTRADALLSDMQALVATARRHGESGAGTLRIGYVPLLVIGRFIEELGQLDVEVQTYAEPASLTLLKLLSTGRVDVALLERFDGTEAHHFTGLAVRTLATEPIFVGITEGHPAIRAGVVDLADLAGCDWILPPPHENCVRVRFLQACAAAGFSPRVRHFTSEAGTAGTLIAQGAVCLAQAASAPPPGLLALPLAGDPLWTTLLFATREEDARTPTADEVFRCAETAYVASRQRNPHFARWCRQHPGERLATAR